MAARVEGSSISRMMFLMISIGKPVDAGGGGEGASDIMIEQQSGGEDIWMLGDLGCGKREIWDLEYGKREI